MLLSMAAGRAVTIASSARPVPSTRSTTLESGGKRRDSSPAITTRNGIWTCCPVCSLTKRATRSGTMSATAGHDALSSYAALASRTTARAVCSSATTTCSKSCDRCTRGARPSRASTFVARKESRCTATRLPTGAPSSSSRDSAKRCRSCSDRTHVDR